MQRKNLVICCAGDESQHIYWFKEEEDEKRTYDIIVIYYGNSAEKEEEYKATSDIFFKGTGFKFNLIRQFIWPYIQTTPSFANYEQIWIPDDDIEISVKNINRMFVVANERNAHIYQPSIANYLNTTRFPSNKRWYSWAPTLTNTAYTYRRLNFIEIMMPGFSAEAFRIIFLPSIILYDKIDIGWPLSHIWNILTKTYSYSTTINAFIFDDICAFHIKPVSVGSILHKLATKECEVYNNSKIYVCKDPPATLEYFK